MVKRCCWGKCKSDSRYPDRVQGVKFIPFPKSSEGRLLWTELCGWPLSQVSADKRDRDSDVFVCSKHFVDGAPTPCNPNPLPAGTAVNRAGGATMSAEERCLGSSGTLAGLGRAPSSDNGDHRGVGNVQCSKSEKIIPVTIKEEPFEIDMRPDVEQQDEEETQVLCGRKQEDLGSVGTENQHCKHESHGKTVPMSTSGSDEETSDEEMAVVTVKEEMLEYDSDLEDEQLCMSDSEQNFHTKTITARTESPNDSIQGSEDNIRTAVVWPLDVQKTYQRNRSVKMQTVVSQRSQILDGENSPKQSEQTEGLYICSDCGKDFFGETELKVHQRSHRIDHMRSDNDTFALKLPSNNQEISQEVNTPFRCSHCDKGFARKGQLNRHEFIHSGQKPFRCSDCGKCFGNKWQLSAHQKIHLGEKPYSCTFCEKCFIRKGELTVHLKRHTGDKPFNCSFCGKGFTTKGEVNIHQRRHVGEKTGLTHPSSLAAKTQLS